MNTKIKASPGATGPAQNIEQCSYGSNLIQQARHDWASYFPRPAGGDSAGDQSLLEEYLDAHVRANEILQQYELVLPRGGRHG